MADNDFPKVVEEDDVARARAFWKSNGKSIVIGAVLGLLAVVGYNLWQNYQINQSELASETYFHFLQQENEAALLVDLENLKSNSIAPAYAELASLRMAKSYVDQAQWDKAQQQLKWVVYNSENTGIQHIARLRLASVLLVQGLPGEALELLEVADKSEFSAKYYELRGDAYVLRANDQDRERAIKSYQLSKQAIINNVELEQLLDLKLRETGHS